MTWPRATRNLKRTDACQLTAMLDAAAVLLEHERHISPDVITALCQIREETAAELNSLGNAVSLDVESDLTDLRSIIQSPLGLRHSDGQSPCS